MPTEQLSLGVPTTLLVGTTYALPSMQVVVFAQGGTIEISNDGATWGAIPAHGIVAAKFIHTTVANSLVTIQRA